MIVNLTKGKSARGGLTYDYGPGNKEEHENPRRVAGNVPGRDYRQRASRFDRAEKSYRVQSGRVPKTPVIRMAVAANPDDKVMTDRQWGKIARETVDRFTGGKSDRYPWEAVRHDDKHIHITLSRCGADGKLLSSSNDYRRAQKIGRDIEKRHGLIDTKNRVLGKDQDRERESVRTGRGDTAPQSNGRAGDPRDVSGRRASDHSDETKTDQRNREQGVDNPMSTDRTFREQERPYELDGSESIEQEQQVKEAANAEMGGNARQQAQSRQAGRDGERRDQDQGKPAANAQQRPARGGQRRELDRETLSEIMRDTKPDSPERRAAIQDARKQLNDAPQRGQDQQRQQEQQQRRERERGRER